ncbi:MAG: hypothetical protein J3K34DRAFT_107558 [Monoraphidium minutum]|nr:MAG: hypothetical protein J3K34DRAFT_107558 [Monoraphidium minutum]
MHWQRACKLGAHLTLALRPLLDNWTGRKQARKLPHLARGCLCGGLLRRGRGEARAGVRAESKRASIKARNTKRQGAALVVGARRARRQQRRRRRGCGRARARSSAQRERCAARVTAPNRPQASNPTHLFVSKSLCRDDRSCPAGRRGTGGAQIDSTTLVIRAQRARTADGDAMARTGTVWGAVWRAAAAPLSRRARAPPLGVKYNQYPLVYPRYIYHSVIDTKEAGIK